MSTEAEMVFPRVMTTEKVCLSPLNGDFVKLLGISGSNTSIFVEKMQNFKYMQFCISSEWTRLF